MRHILRIYVLTSVIWLFFICGTADARSIIDDENILTSPENIVKAYYNRLSFEAGESPDWEKVKSLFIDEAVIAVRTNIDKIDVLSKESYVQVLIQGIKKYELLKTGFHEKILNSRIKIIGDLAYCVVLYMAWIPNLAEPGTADVETKGVDVFQLLKVDNDWKIISLTNEVIRPGVPIPDELIKKAEDG